MSGAALSPAPAPAPAPASIEDYALSVLLHDIGKFWERSSEAPTPSPAELHLFCPRVGEAGVHMHTHAALSSRFIREMVGIDGAERWGPRHHLPDGASREEICAQLGDLLAHGAGEPDESRDAPGAAAAPLLSLLREAGPRFLPFVRLGAGADTVFPRASVPLSREDYRFHWNHFLQAIEKGAAGRADLDAWLGLLEEFATRIPAGSTSRQLRAIGEIDLFTHSRLVAAIAVALYRGPLPLPRLLVLRSALQNPRPEEPADLICSIVVGEITGRRDFLACAASGEGDSVASLSRRASFIRGLTRTASLAAVRRCELPSTSILWVESGKFCLLAPAGADAAPLGDSLADFSEEGARAGLDLVAAATDLGFGDFRSGLATAWMRLEESLRRAKRERIARRARVEYDRVFAADAIETAASTTAASATVVSGSIDGGRVELVRPPWEGKGRRPRLAALSVAVEGRERAYREALTGPGRTLARELILRAEIERLLECCGPAEMARREPERYVHLALDGDEVLLASGIDGAIAAFLALRESFRRAVDRPGLVLSAGLAWGPAHRSPWMLVEEARTSRSFLGASARRTGSTVVGSKVVGSEAEDRIAFGGRVFDAKEVGALREIARDVARSDSARSLGALSARRWLPERHEPGYDRAALFSTGFVPKSDAARRILDWLFEEGQENMAKLPLAIGWAEEIHEGDSSDGIK